jgi:hypothetical protein
MAARPEGKARTPLPAMALMRLKVTALTLLLPMATVVDESVEADGAAAIWMGSSDDASSEALINGASENSAVAVGVLLLPRSLHGFLVKCVVRPSVWEETAGGKFLAECGSEKPSTTATDAPAISRSTTRNTLKRVIA